MSKYFFDTEFLDKSSSGIACHEIISIGIACDDGRTLYLENAAFNWNQEMDPWMVENVQVHLAGEGSAAWAAPDEMALQITEFIGSDSSPEFWAYVASSDWMALISLFGRLVDRPERWPSRVRELKDEIERAGRSKDDLPKQDAATAHNALDDALWNLQVARAIGLT